MQHSEHVNLIKKAISKNFGGIWADLGSGDGAFTLALRDLAGMDATIYSVDKDAQRLQTQEKRFEIQFPATKINFIQKDFTTELELPALDGIIMANSLHYVKDQNIFLTKIKKYLRPQGTMVFVEYNIDEGNQWVPYPLSYPSLERLVKSVGFIHAELLEKIPSTYWDEMYSAKAW